MDNKVNISCFSWVIRNIHTFSCSLKRSLSHSSPFYSACTNRNISPAVQISETGVTRRHPRFVCSNSSISLHPQRKAEMRMLNNVVNYMKTRFLQFLKRINLCQKVRVLLYVVLWNAVARVFWLVAMPLLCYSRWLLGYLSKSKVSVIFCSLNMRVWIWSDHWH